MTSTSAHAGETCDAAAAADKAKKLAWLEKVIQKSFQSLAQDLQNMRPPPPQNTLPSYKHSYFLDFVRESNLIYADGVTAEVAFAQNSTTTTTTDQTNDYLEPFLHLYKDYRAKSAGGMSISLFGHFMHPLSSSIYSDLGYRQILLTLSLLTGIHNDLISYHKDDSWDMMTIWMRFGDCNEEDAKQNCIQQHFELLQHYQTQSNNLLQKYPADHEALSYWLDTILPTYMRGILAWQCHVKRYEDTQKSSKKLFEQLFPHQTPHILVNETTGRLPGEDEERTWRTQINQASLAWAKETGLIPLIPEEKWQALDLGLAAILVHSYCTVDCDSELDEEHTLPGLVAFAKYLGWIIVVDDVMEEPNRHEQIKAVFVKCMMENL